MINEKGDKEYFTKINNRLEDGEEVSAEYYRSYQGNTYKILETQVKKDKEKMAELRTVGEK
ncbi:MAG: hypothetical protein QW046_04745 [Candidatus Micrarchaeaceae archaeon]